MTNPKQLTKARAAYLAAIDTANEARIAQVTANKAFAKAEDALDEAARAYYAACEALGRDPGFATDTQKAWDAGRAAHNLGYGYDQVAPIFSTSSLASAWQDGWDAAAEEAR